MVVNEDHLRRAELTNQPSITTEEVVALDFLTESTTPENDEPGENPEEPEDPPDQSAAAAQPTSPIARAYPKRARLPPQRFEPNL
jgi:hypothetical protein